MPWKLNVVLGPTKVLFSTIKSLTKVQEKTCFVVRKFQSKVEHLDLIMSRMLAALTNIQTRLVTVIVLNGQRAKPSDTSLNLQVMRINGSKVTLRLGNSWLKTVTSTSNKLSEKKMLLRKLNAASSEPRNSVRVKLTRQCVLGSQNQPLQALQKQEDQRSIAIYSQKLHQSP